MSDADLSFVIQGPVLAPPHGDTASLVAAIRHGFPRAEIVISTWTGQPVEGVSAGAQVVRSMDPGPATGVPPKAANLRRLITSTSAGLDACSRAFVVKLRSDARFAGSLSTWEMAAPWDETRIALAMHSTPYVPYFLDDKTQIGALSSMKRFWLPEWEGLVRRFREAEQVALPRNRAFLFAQDDAFASEQALFLRHCALELDPGAAPAAWTRSYLDSAAPCFRWLNAPRLGFGSFRFSYRDRPALRTYLALMNRRPSRLKVAAFHTLATLRALKHRPIAGDHPEER